MQFINSKKYFVVVDCNNFFASCEKVFRPDLKDKPVIVMSSNDGCVVARSREVKELGIPMGVPMFQIKDLIKKHNITVFSSNFSLYENFSNRIYQILCDEFDNVYRYSIDESFINLSVSEYNLDKLKKVAQRVYRETGVPVTIGAGFSKTLAKLASEIGKKKKELVCILKEGEFEELNVSEVWGIGRQTVLHLSSINVSKIKDLLKLSAIFINKNFGISLYRTYLELKGVSCIELGDVNVGSKSISSTRSFGNEISDLSEIASAVSFHLSNAFYKLREQNSLAKTIRIFICSNRFKKDKYYLSDFINLDYPTDDEIVANSIVQKKLKEIFIEGVLYKKAGVILSDFIKRGSLPSENLFGFPVSSESILMKVMDKINDKWGDGTVRISTFKIKNSWQSKAVKKSPNYLSDWNEIPIINTK
jgi:DNA polymerase V